MISDDEVLARLLYKLLNNKCFRKGHMLEERVVSSVPKHNRGRAKSILKQAIKSGLVVMYGKTKYGLAYQLNTERLDEIIAFIRKYYEHHGSMKI